MKELEFSNDDGKTFSLDIGIDEIFITILGKVSCDHACLIEQCFTLHDLEAMKVYEILKKYFGDKSTEEKQTTALEKIENHLEELAKCVIQQPYGHIFRIEDYS